MIMVIWWLLGLEDSPFIRQNVLKRKALNVLWYQRERIKSVYD